MKITLVFLAPLLLGLLAAVHAAGSQSARVENATAEKPRTVPLIDVTETLRTDRRGLTEAMIGEGRRRDAGFIPVLQLNAIFERDVPCATTPYLSMKSFGDKMPDALRFQQQGVELILKTLRDSLTAVHIVSFGSAHAIAAVYNREPDLLRKKVASLHLYTGQSSPPIPNYLEHNV